MEIEMRKFWAGAGQLQHCGSSNKLHLEWRKRKVQYTTEKYKYI